MEDKNNIISDLNKSLKAKLYDRLTDPFLGSYTLFLITINWKFFYIILKSNKNVFDTIKYIDEEYFKSKCDVIIFFILPFLASIFYIFIYPYIKKIILKFSYNKKIELKNLKKECEETEILTIIESQELKKKEAYERKVLTDSINNIRENIDEFRHYIEKEFSRLLKLGPNTIRCVFKRENINIGNWVYIDNNIADKAEYKSSVSGVVIDIVNNSYCIVQSAGLVEVDKIEFTNLVTNRRYILSKRPGEIEEIKPNVPNRIEVGTYTEDKKFKINIIDHRKNKN